MAEKKSYEELKDILAAMLAAGADEQTFGASSLASDALGGDYLKKVQEANPGFSTIGRIGSYIPGMFAGTGEAALAKKGISSIAKYLPTSYLAKGASKVGNKIKGEAPGLLKNILGSAVESGGLTGATNLSRNLVNKGANLASGDTLPQEDDSVVGSSLFSAGLGAGGGALGSLGKFLYSHPLQSKGISSELVDELMQKGVYGGKKKFLDQAGKYAGEVEEKLNKPIAELVQKHGSEMVPYEQYFNPLKEGIDVLEGTFGKTDPQSKAMKSILSQQHNKLRGGTSDAGEAITSIADLVKGSKDTNIANRMANPRFGELAPPGKKMGAELSKESFDNAVNDLVLKRLGKSSSESMKSGRAAYGKQKQIEGAFDNGDKAPYLSPYGSIGQKVLKVGFQDPAAMTTAGMGLSKTASGLKKPLSLATSLGTRNKEPAENKFDAEEYGLSSKPKFNKKEYGLE